MTGLPKEPAAPDGMPDLVVPLPPEILAMMASFDAAPTPDEANMAETNGNEATDAPLLAAIPDADGEPADALRPEPEGEPLVLAPVLDLTAAAALHAALLARRGAPLSVDASGVKRLGGQCLQLLLSARLTWAADGVPIALGAASEAFGRDLALLGLSESELFESEAA